MMRPQIQYHAVEGAPVRLSGGLNRQAHPRSSAGRVRATCQQIRTDHKCYELSLASVMARTLLCALLGLGLMHGVCAQRTRVSGPVLSTTALKLASATAPNCDACIASDQAFGETCAQADPQSPCCVANSPKACTTADDTNQGPLCCNDPPVGCEACIASDQAFGKTCAQADPQSPCCVANSPNACTTADDTNQGPLCCNDPPVGCEACIASDQAFGKTCAQADPQSPCCVANSPKACTTADDTNQGPLCCNDPSIGGVVSDPIFSSFNGGKFEFLGKAGGIYNVLSSTRHQVNMLLVETGEKHIRLQPGEGTFVQTFAFIINQSRVAVMVSEEGDMSVTLEDEDLDLDQPFSFNTSATRLQFDPHYPGKGERLEILSDMFQFAVVAVLAYEDKESGYNRGHLDLSVSILSDPGKLSGILGSTLHMPATASVGHADHTFYDVGHENEYAISELFGTMASSTSLSRRRLIEVPTHDELVFPLTAGLSSQA